MKTGRKPMQRAERIDKKNLSSEGTHAGALKIFLIGQIKPGRAHLVALCLGGYSEVPPYPPDWRFVAAPGCARLSVPFSPSSNCLLCRILINLTILQTFSLLSYLYGDL